MVYVKGAQHSFPYSNISNEEIAHPSNSFQAVGGRRRCQDTQLNLRSGWLNLNEDIYAAPPLST